MGDITFDEQGKIYGLLYADIWRNLENPKDIKVRWIIKTYSSEKSRNAHIREQQAPGRPLFSFELDIKTLAELGKPIPFVPDERRRKLPPKNDYYWGEYKLKRRSV